MKYNLKNRPAFFNEGQKKLLDKWFEGFEKELREIQKNWHKTPSRWVSVDNPHIPIKEILGEK